MSNTDQIESAKRQAWIDWTLTGEFNAGQFSGDAMTAYSKECERIQRYWDNQGE